jgi:hypothetical protein
MDASVHCRCNTRKMWALLRFMPPVAMICTIDSNQPRFIRGGRGIRIMAIIRIMPPDPMTSIIIIVAGVVSIAAPQISCSLVASQSAFAFFCAFFHAISSNISIPGGT